MYQIRLWVRKFAQEVNVVRVCAFIHYYTYERENFSCRAEATAD